MPQKVAPGLDLIDIKILVALQRHGRLPVVKLAHEVALSARPCLERVRRLEAAGIILGYHAEVAIERLASPVTVFAEIALESQGGPRQKAFERRIASIENVVECWEVSGPHDYIVRFVCRDLAGYQALTADLLDEPELGIARLTSAIALRPVRRFAGYPRSLFDSRQN